MLRMLLERKIFNWQIYIKNRVHPMAVLRRNADFIIYSTLSQNTQGFVLLFIQMGIAGFFSATDAGHYILAVSILSMPASLIALTTSAVVYRHFIEIKQTHPEKLLRHLVLALMGYLLLGIFILSPIFFFGDVIFAFVIGEIWTAAGSIAATLSIAYAGAFAVVGVQSIFQVTHQMKFQFLLELCLSVLILIIGIWVIKTMPFDRAILYLSFAWFLRNAMLLCASVYVTAAFTKKNHA
jgi:O-antigen/teichoic acid export membrane protein